MNGTARSGKQCIAEGSLNSATSKKLELKLIGNARGSFGELLEDYEDFLRQRNLPLWGKDSQRVKKIRALICLIHQENFLLDQLKRKLEKDFLEKGGFTERLYAARRKARK